MMCNFLLGLVVQACRGEERLGEGGMQVGFLCCFFCGGGGGGVVVCLFVLPWVVLIIFGSLSQQSQEILEAV